MKKNWSHSGFIGSLWTLPVDSAMVLNVTMIKDRPKPPQFGHAFKNYEMIYCLGDSVMAHLIGGSYPDIPGESDIRRSNMVIQKTGSVLNTTTVYT
mmetsp:Transcript_7173/g.8170  ORF Transcript_7173/g.8170 Transcript_7173/m.8170 type:complete len:96 (+) Transcript_7173:309-596(+)